MKNEHEYELGRVYLFESLASANSVFFKSKIEIRLFKKLAQKYLGEYIDICNVYIDKNGYHMIVKIRQRRTVLKKYMEKCMKKGRDVNVKYIQKPWKIISEHMRIFKSVYVKAINKLRGRQGVLVKHSFKRYEFQSVGEFESYKESMERGLRIDSQLDKSYEVSDRKSEVKNWKRYRAREWSEMYVYKGFQNIVRRMVGKKHPTPQNPIQKPPNS